MDNTLGYIIMIEILGLAIGLGIWVWRISSVLKGIQKTQISLLKRIERLERADNNYYIVHNHTQHRLIANAPGWVGQDNKIYLNRKLCADPSYVGRQVRVSAWLSDGEEFSMVE